MPLCTRERFPKYSLDTADRFDIVQGMDAAVKKRPSPRPSFLAVRIWDARVQEEIERDYQRLRDEVGGSPSKSRIVERILTEYYTRRESA